MSALGQLGKLPVELRKEIFTLCLQETEQIQIERWSKHEVIRAGYGERYYYHGYYRARRWIPIPNGPVALLKVSKEIKDEAAPVFYGSNVFNFKSSVVLEDFLKRSPEMAQYLRHIKVAGPPIFEQDSLKRAAKALVAAKNLRRLEFSHVDFCHYRDENTWHDLKVLVFSRCCNLSKPTSTPRVSTSTSFA